MKLSDIGKAPKEKNEDDEQEATQVNTINYGNSAFHIHDLKRHWENYQRKMERDGRITESLILKGEMSFDNDTITVAVDNHIQLEKTDTFKEELMQYLRSKLNNGKIYLQAKLNDKPKESKVYTSQEKFNHLAKKHPILERFKQEFGLETGF